MFSKLGLTLLIICLFSLALVPAVSAQAEINVLLTGCPQSNMMEQLLPEFEAETGIDVKLEIVGYEDTHTKGVLDLVSGTNNYDVLMVDNPWIAEYVQTGNLLALDQFMEKEDPEYLDGFAPLVLDTYGLYQNKYYGYPIMFGELMLFYRADLFEQYSDEYKAKYGTSLGAERGDGAISMWLSWLWGYGGEVFDKDWNVTLDTPEALQALEAFIESSKYAARGYGTNYFPEQLAYFINGEAAMVPTWDAFAGDTVNPEKCDYADSVGFAPVPGGYPLLGGWALSINKNSGDVEAAYQFLRWACGTEVTRKSLDIEIVTPTRIDVARDPEVRAMVPWISAAYEGFGNVRKYAEAYQGGPILIPEAEYHIILGTAINEALTGQLDPEEALAKAQREIHELLETNGYY